MACCSFTMDADFTTEFTNITDAVQKLINDVQVRSGLCLVYTKHTTACVRIIEDEKLLMSDMHDFFERIAPSTVLYRHDDLDHRTVPVDERRNGFAHLRAMLLNHQELIPIVKGRLDLGQWQKLFYLDCDFGKKGRTYNVLIMEF